MGIYANLQDMDATALSRWLSLLNIIVAILVSIAGLLSLLDILDFAQWILGVYAIIFGSILILYHLRFGFVLRWMIRNFGFMYYWSGRAAYLSFLGFMCFGFGTVGIVAACFAFVDVVINVLAMKINKNMHEVVENDEAKLRKTYGGRLHALVSEDADLHHISRPNSDHHNTSKSTSIVPDTWEEIVDPESGSSYWYNSKTGETTWDPPK